MPDEYLPDLTIGKPPAGPSEEDYAALEARTRAGYAASQGISTGGDPEAEANAYLSAWTEREWPATQQRWASSKSPTLAKAASVEWVSPYADKIRSDLNAMAASGRGLSPAAWKRAQDKLQARVAVEAERMQRRLPAIAQESTSDPTTRAYVALLRQRNAMAGTVGVTLDGITGHLRWVLNNAIGPWPVIPQIEHSLSGNVQAAAPAELSSAQAAAELERSRAGDLETRIPQLAGIARGAGAQAVALAGLPGLVPRMGTVARWLAPQAAMAIPAGVGIAQQQIEGAVTGNPQTPSLGAQVAQAGGGLARGAGVMAGASVALKLLGFRGSAVRLILPLLAENLTNPEVADTFARAGTGDPDAERAAVDHVVSMLAMAGGAHVGGGVAPNNEAANAAGRVAAIDRHSQQSLEYIRANGAKEWLRARAAAGNPVTLDEVRAVRAARVRAIEPPVAGPEPTALAVVEQPAAESAKPAEPPPVEPTDAQPTAQPGPYETASMPPLDQATGGQRAEPVAAPRAEPAPVPPEPAAPEPAVQEPAKAAPVGAEGASFPAPDQRAVPTPEPATAQAKAIPEAPTESRTPQEALPVPEGHLFGRTELHKVEPNFSRIVREYGKRRGVPRSAWDDLYQEAWMAVRSAEGSYDPAKPAEAFVRTIVDRTALDYRAKLSTKTAKIQEGMTEEAAAGAVSRETPPDVGASGREKGDRILGGEPIDKVLQGTSREEATVALSRLGEKLSPEQIEALFEEAARRQRSPEAKRGETLFFSGLPFGKILAEGLGYAYRIAKETVVGTNRVLIDDLVQRVGAENDPNGLAPKLHEVERQIQTFGGKLFDELHPLLKEFGAFSEGVSDLSLPIQTPDGTKSVLAHALENPSFRASLSPKLRAQVEQVVRLQNATGALMEQEKLRILLGDREKYADFKNRGGNVAVNMPTKDMSEAIRVGSGPLYEAIIEAYAASPKNQAWVKRYGKGLSAKEFFRQHFMGLHAEMTKPGRESGELSFNSEFARVFPFSPDFVDVGGKTVALHVNTPYAYANTLASKVAIRLAFNKVFGTGDKSTLRSELEMHASANRGGLTAFQASQAISGIGVDRPLTTPGTEMRWVADGWKNFTTARKAHMLSGSYFIQLPEILGNIQSQIPVMDFFKLIFRNHGGRTIQRLIGHKAAFDALTSAFERNGIITTEVPDYSIDPARPWRSYTRALSSAAARLLGHHYANEAQERTSAAAQVLVEERFAQGKATAYDKTAEMRLGFSAREVEHHAATAKERYDAARAAGKGHIEAILDNPYSLRACQEAPRWLVGANRKASGASRVEQNPIFKEVFYFSRFPLHMARMIVRDGQVLADAWKAGRKDLVLAQAWRIARATGGKIAAGQIGYLLTSQIFNGSEDRKAKWNEMTRSPGAFLNSCLQAYLYQLGGGPLGSIMRVYAASGNKSEAALRSTIPGSTVAEIYDLMAGTGEYRKDSTSLERAWRFYKRATPGLRAAETLAFTVGLGAPDKERDAWVSAYWRYCRDNGLYDSGQEAKQKESTNVFYRMHIAIRNGRAEQAKRILDEYIAKNGLNRGEALQKSRLSMRSRMFFRDWTEQQKTHFRGLYGDRVYQNLLKMNDLMRLAS